MKKYILPYLIAVIGLFSQPVFSQTSSDTTSLGLAGDNLDLYAVLDLFQKSKTIEDFEKSLNEQGTAVNNLDLDLDKKVDFIKVITKQKESSFTFVLQIAVSQTETQDVAVILVDKDKNGKVTMQIVGDEELYGKDYIIEPKRTAAVTANPAYVGPDPVTENTPATTTIVVESAPIVQYVYSPVYVPYVPPYYYGFYPPYFTAFAVISVGIYRSNHYYYHGGGYGYHHTTVIHNHNNYNNYYGNRNHSDRVSHNNASGRYNNGNRPATRPSSGSSATTRPATTPSNRKSGGLSPSTQPSNRQATGVSPSRQPSDRQSTGVSPSNRSSTRQPTSSYSGGRSMGGGGARMGGGGARGGGGRRR